MPINDLDMYKWRPDRAGGLGIGMGIDPGHSHNIYDAAAKSISGTEILQKMRELQEQIEYQKRANMNVTPIQMIFMRLFRDAKEGQKVHPFEHMNAFVNEKVAVVFIVHNNKPVTIEDDVGLFPSDALITQLRLLIG